MAHSQSGFHLCHRYLSGVSEEGDRPLLDTWFGEHPHHQICPWSSSKAARLLHLCQSLAPSPQTLSFLCTWEAKCTEPSPAPERSFQLCSKAGRAADQIWRELEPHFCLFVFKKSPRGTAKANAATTYNTKLTQPLFLFFGLSNGKLEPLALSLPSTANLFLQSDTLFREVWHCPGTVQGGSHTKPRRNSDEENEQHLHFTFSRNK